MDDTQKCPHVYITDKWGYVLDKEKQTFIHQSFSRFKHLHHKLED